MKITNSICRCNYNAVLLYLVKWEHSKAVSIVLSSLFRHNLNFSTTHLNFFCWKFEILYFLSNASSIKVNHINKTMELLEKLISYKPFSLKTCHNSVTHLIVHLHHSHIKKYSTLYDIKQSSCNHDIPSIYNLRFIFLYKISHHVASKRSWMRFRLLKL